MTSYICLAASHAPQLFKTITALPLEHHQLSPCTRSSPTAPNMLLFFYHIELPAVAPSPLTTIPFLSTPFSNTPIKGFNISLPLLPLFPFLWNQTDLAFPCPTPWMSSYQGHQWPHCQTRRPILRLYRLWNNYHCFLKTLATQWDSIPSWLPSHPTVSAHFRLFAIFPSSSQLPLCFFRTIYPSLTSHMVSEDMGQELCSLLLFHWKISHLEQA